MRQIILPRPVRSERRSKLRDQIATPATVINIRQRLQAGRIIHRHWKRLQAVRRAFGSNETTPLERYRTQLTGSGIGDFHIAVEIIVFHAQTELIEHRRGVNPITDPQRIVLIRRPSDNAGVAAI